jgi:hypothetical protein
MRSPLTFPFATPPALNNGSRGFASEASRFLGSTNVFAKPKPTSDKSGFWDGTSRALEPVLHTARRPDLAVSRVLADLSLSAGRAVVATAGYWELSQGLLPLNSSQLTRVSDVVRLWRSNLDGLDLDSAGLAASFVAVASMPAADHEAEFDQWVLPEALDPLTVSESSDDDWYDAWLYWTLQAIRLGLSDTEILAAIRLRQISLRPTRPPRSSLPLARTATSLRRLQRSIRRHAPPRQIGPTTFAVVSARLN